MKTLKKINPIVWIIIIVILIAVSAVFIMQTKKKSEQVAKLAAEDTESLKAIIASKERDAFVALVDIPMGEVISEQNVMFSSDVSSDMDPEYFMSYDDIGKVAVVNISEGMPILKNMCSDTMLKDLEERECNFIILNANTKNNDYIDVRIMFPTGEDFIIASKKCIKNPQPMLNSCYLWLTEAENDLLSAAIVDANLHKARIYVTKYVKPVIQQGRYVTYQPNEDVMAAIENNPNIVNESEVSLSAQARKNLEQNIIDFYTEYPDYVNSDEVPTDLIGGNKDSLNASSTEEEEYDEYEDYEDYSSTEESSDSTEESEESE